MGARISDSKINYRLNRLRGGPMAMTPLYCVFKVFWRGAGGLNTGQG